MPDDDVIEHLAIIRTELKYIKRDVNKLLKLYSKVGKLENQLTGMKTKLALIASALGIAAGVATSLLKGLFV